MRIGRQLTRYPFNDVPRRLYLDLIDDRRQRIVEFLLRLALEDGFNPLEPPEGTYKLLRVARTKVRQSVPNPAEWGSERGNDGNRDTTEGEPQKIRRVEPTQAQVEIFRREWLGCLSDGIDVQSNLVLEHVGVEDYSSVDLETLPDHPPKGNTSKGMTFAILHGSTADI